MTATRPWRTCPDASDAAGRGGIRRNGLRAVRLIGFAITDRVHSRTDGGAYAGVPM